MTLKPFFLVPFLLILIRDVPLSRGFPGLGDIQTYANFANDAIGVIKGDLPLSALLTGSTGPTLDKILDSISGISKQLDEFGDSFRAQLDAQSRRFDERFDEMNAKLDKILIDIPLDGKAYSLTRELHAYIVRVDNLYAKYERYSAGRDKFNNFTIKKFIDAVISDKQGDLDDTLSRVFALIIPERSDSFTDGILDILALQMASTADIIVCGTKKSAQMQLYEIYESIVITETRGFIMSIFSYAVMSVFERTPFEAELDFLRDQLVKRMDDYLRITAKSMRRLAQKIELCDANKYTEDINYIKLDSVSDDDSERGRAVNMMAQIADIKNNKIMSGIRFVSKSDKMIEYQIQEARLLPQGVIDNRNQSWKELPQFIFDKAGRWGGSYEYANGTKMKLRDYFPIGGPLRGMLMDDLVLPHDYVLAGVQFNLHISTHFFIPSIYGVKFDFESGKLDANDTMWKHTEYVFDGHLDVAGLPQRMLPTDAEKNFIDTEPESVFIMGPVGKRHSPIVPFFDTRPVEMRTMGLALSGLGLYHRGAAGYGGYFNFRLFTIDLSEYVIY